VEINFFELEKNPLRMYGGRNGSKIGVVYEGENYMLKFPPKLARNPDMSYSNSCISEYVACHIFSALGIDAQETLLGRYNEKIAVACKDFERDGFVLRDFAQLKNTIIDSEQNGYGTDLQDILKTIQDQQIVPPAELGRFFWEMFIGDALLGNFDRHNGNWGFLVSGSTGEVRIAPVFDCGSCLYPQLDESRMSFVLGDAKEMEARLFVYPTSAIQQEGKKLNYFQFLMTTESRECLDALKRIGGGADLSKILSVIDETPYISDMHKRFLGTMVRERKEKIIEKALYSRC
jgi:hypothetical protein